MPLIVQRYILSLLFTALTLCGYSQVESSIIRISKELVNNEVTSIIQDKNGFVWFGTRGGLQRFDGYELKLLKNDFTTGNNLLSQSIEVLLNGKHNNIWIGTKSGGVSSYDLKTGIITNFPHIVSNSNGFNSDYILSLFDSDDDRLFIGTWKGFQYLNKKTGAFKIINNTWKTFQIQPDKNNGYWLATNSGLRHLTKQFVNDTTYNFNKPNINITSIVHDVQYNCLWLGTWDQGLIQFDLQTRLFKQYKNQRNNPSSLSSNNTYRLHLDSKGNLWVATWGAGLNRLDRSTGVFEKIDLNIPGLNTIDSKIILTIQEDPSGLLWIGTDGAGVFKLDLNQKEFLNIGGKINPLIGSTHVISVYKDPFQKLWVGTKGGGIQYSHDGKNFKQLQVNFNQNITDPTSSFISRSFLQDGNYLWIATNKGLIRILNTGVKPGAFEIFLPNKNNPAAIIDRKLDVLIKDAVGRIWVGTQESGLSCITGFDQKNKPLFKNYLTAFGVKGALQNERISCMLVDSKKRLWVGTYKGLHLYDAILDRFQVFLQAGDQAKSISNNTILSLIEDKKGNIWAGTQSGLNKITGIVNNELQVLRYTRADGLPNDYIHAVLCDANNNIWASTNKGIIQLNTLTNAIAVFDKRDGVKSDIFSENASFTDINGQLFFGGLEGLTYFTPENIRINNFQPPIYFTNLIINNESYDFGKREGDSLVLSRPFYETKTITLNYKENIFSIGFSALDYHAPDKNEYTYQLVGFNKNWVNAGTNRLVTFTNLKAGTYILKVKATNSDKIWNPVPHELKIIILPPPWRTWWAYTIYVFVFIFLLWLTRYFGIRQVDLKNQLMFTRMGRLQEKKLSDFKERLFTNISHEFRTPLTLILGPLEDLLQSNKLEASVEKSLRLMQKQSKRLLRMVNQLLDYQKSEAGSLKLVLQPGEMVSFCNDIYSGFKDEATRRRIDYSFHSNDKYISFVYDHNKLEIVVFNVLSNAFKFTPDGGKIRLAISKKTNGWCEIKISDSGRGIPADEIDKIFDRFYRGREDDVATISGSGIGLSFVRELIELHEGSITATNNDVKGAEFIINLPPAKLPEMNFPINAEPLQANETFHETNLISEVMLDNNDHLNQEQELPIILVVEDETDIQQYVYDILSPTFKVITASNGKEGLSRALESIPDLIVSDIMMPEMDGIELCRTLKLHKDTSHIPIILLTALSDMAHHVQGIQEGADVYLPKPFNSQLLLVHVHNLINSRNKLKELYAKRVLLGTGSFEIKTYEEEFLFKLMKLVENNISNSNFSNDDLANLMFMSRSTFYRKLKAVTGMSGNEFMRTARLNYASKLLESGNYSVTEAAYEAGFNDIKYFRKRFQDQFGVSPSEYKS